MLVLSRKLSESVVIGDGIRVTVVRVQGQQVRLGIEADKSIPVHRGEVWDRMERERERAGGGEPRDEPGLKGGLD